MMLSETPFRKNATVYGPYWTAWNYTSGVTFGQPINSRVACGGGVNGCPYAWGGGSAHTGGMHMVKADGAVAFVSENIAFSILQGLVTITGGELLGEF